MTEDMICKKARMFAAASRDPHSYYTESSFRIEAFKSKYKLTVARSRGKSQFPEEGREISASTPSTNAEGVSSLVLTHPLSFPSSSSTNIRGEWTSANHEAGSECNSRVDFFHPQSTDLLNEYFTGTVQLSRSPAMPDNGSRAAALSSSPIYALSPNPSIYDATHQVEVGRRGQQGTTTDMMRQQSIPIVAPDAEQMHVLLPTPACSLRAMTSGEEARNAFGTVMKYLAVELEGNEWMHLVNIMEKLKAAT